MTATSTVPEVSAPDGVDVVAVGEWLRTVGVGTGEPVVPVPLHGGTQNLLFLLEVAGRRLVLRRPPLQKRARSDDTIRREMRVLGALAGSGVPHPRLVAGCEDLDLLGCAFYLMEAVDGWCPMAGIPDAFGDPARQHAIGLGIVDAIVALGAVDPAAHPADLERADGWLDRQVDRWQGQLQTYATDDLPAAGPVADALRAAQPAPGPIGVIHGDVHFGNVLVDHVEPRIAALLDWELSTVGDPRLDLGHLLATWPSERPDALTRRPRAEGLPSRAELIARYATGSGNDVTDIDWFQALACFRLAVIIEGTHARAREGAVPAPLGDGAHRGAERLLAQASALLP